MHDYELYGFSLFETFLAKRGTFWRLDRHWQRLSSAAPKLGLAPPSWDRFKNEILDAHDPGQCEVLRYTLMRVGGRWSSSEPATRAQVLKKPFEPAVRPHVRLALPAARLPCRDFMRGFKSGSRLEYQVRFEEAVNRGFDDSLMVDEEGRLLETTTSNLLFLIEDRWVTPPASLGLLPGIARDWLLERGLVREEPVHLDDLPAIRAAVTTNAVQGYRPVRRLGQRDLSVDRRDPFIQRIGKRPYAPLP